MNDMEIIPFRSPYQ